MTIEIQNLLESRLKEIDAEIAQLRRALEHLGPTETKSRKPGRLKTSRRRGGGKRAGRGERQRQVLDSIKKMPGASANELADAMGIGATQVYGLLRKAEAKKLITKSGQGFTAIS